MSKPESVNTKQQKLKKKVDGILQDRFYTTKVTFKQTEIL